MAQYTLQIDGGGGAVSTQLDILKMQLGATAVDLWSSVDAHGRPTGFLRRIKSPEQDEGKPVELGAPGDVAGKVVQWIWMPALPPGSSDTQWQVRITFFQGGAPIGGSPFTLPPGDYPAGSKHDIAQTWFQLVAR